MAFQLPLLPDVPHYRFGATLAGTPYLIDMRWNDRAAAWFMDVFTEDETPIRVGVKVVLGTPLGSRTADAAFPAGNFIATDLSGDGRDAGLADLGVRVMIDFYELGEL